MQTKTLSLFHHVSLLQENRWLKLLEHLFGKEIVNLGFNELLLCPGGFPFLKKGGVKCWAQNAVATVENYFGY